eukprot:TRINITY_DN71014_c0_g1_i1.p1 TRINITY_DN71014_c0_g1~~TRINITY_DN71014_c0_g1_i1.p1  ORF type:complete len:204 (+),score=46.15 TRINITY_DN71014_c0_g1_i1:45-614(+)
MAPAASLLWTLLLAIGTCCPSFASDTWPDAAEEAAAVAEDDECRSAGSSGAGSDCSLSALQASSALLKASEDQDDLEDLSSASELPPGIEVLDPKADVDAHDVCGKYKITNHAKIGCCGSSPYYFSLYGCCGNAKLFRQGPQGCCYEPGSDAVPQVYNTHKQLCCQAENKVCSIKYTRYSCCTGNAGHL